MSEFNSLYRPEFKPMRLVRDFSPDGAATRVVMLGSGTPMPDPHRRGAASAVIVGSQPYLVDCGEGVWRAIGAAAAGHGGEIADALAPEKLTHVFITHLHSDHTTGLPALFLSTWITGRVTPLHIWGPPGTERLASNVKEAYSGDIAERISGQESVDPKGLAVSVTEVDGPGSVYSDERVRVEAIQAHHGNFTHAFGYRFTTDDRVVVVAGDGRPSPEIREASRGADLLFHEVSTVDDGPAPWGAQDVVWAYHTGTDDLVDLANDARPKMLVLYHTQNWHQPYDEERLVAEMKRKGYEGEVVEARDTDVF